MRLKHTNMQKQLKRLKTRSNAFVYTASAARVKLLANNVIRVGKVTFAMCHVTQRMHMSIRIRRGTTPKMAFIGHNK